MRIVGKSDFLEQKIRLSPGRSIFRSQKRVFLRKEPFCGAKNGADGGKMDFAEPKVCLTAGESIFGSEKSVFLREDGFYGARNRSARGKLDFWEQKIVPSGGGRVVGPQRTGARTDRHGTTEDRGRKTEGSAQRDASPCQIGNGVNDCAEVDAPKLMRRNRPVIFSDPMTKARVGKEVGKASLFWR